MHQNPGLVDTNYSSRFIQTKSKIQNLMQGSPRTTETGANNNHSKHIHVIYSFLKNLRRTHNDKR